MSFYDVNFEKVGINMTQDFEVKVCGKSCSVVKYNKVAMGDIVIPAFINGKPVSRLEQRAFKRAAMKSITIPEHVEEICMECFSYCKYLTNIIIKGCNLKNIGSNILWYGH